MLIKKDEYSTLVGPELGDPASLIRFMTRINANTKVINVKEITPGLEALKEFGFIVEDVKPTMEKSQTKQIADSSSKLDSPDAKPKSIMSGDSTQEQHGSEVIQQIKKNGPKREARAKFLENKLERLANSKLANFGRDTVDNYLRSSMNTSNKLEEVQTEENFGGTTNEDQG